MGIVGGIREGEVVGGVTPLAARIISTRRFLPEEICGEEKIINGFTTAFAVLHLVTLTIKDGSLYGSDHLVQSRGN